MKIFTRKTSATPRRREGLPRRRGLPKHRQLHLGEPADRDCRRSGPPRRGNARLGEGKLCLGVPAMVQGLCL